MQQGLLALDSAVHRVHRPGSYWNPLLAEQREGGVHAGLCLVLCQEVKSACQWRLMSISLAGLTTSSFEKLASDQDLPACLLLKVVFHLLFTSSKNSRTQSRCEPLLCGSGLQQILKGGFKLAVLYGS